MQWLELPASKVGDLGSNPSLAFNSVQGGGPRVVVSTAAFHARVRGSVPGLGGFKETKLFLPHPRVKVSIVGSLRDREVACSASDRQGSNFESCVWRTVSSQSSHHPQEVLLAQFSLYVHKGGLKPDSFHFILTVFKFQRNKNVSSCLLVYKDFTLCGASVTERWHAGPQTVRARISNPVSGGQCHLTHLTIQSS